MIKKNRFAEKYITMLGLLLIISTAECKKNNPGEKYVIARGGLNLRAGADLTSKTIAHIPFGSTVTVISIKKEAAAIVDPDTKNLVSGRWTKVTWGKKQGWVFGAYLAGEEQFNSIRYQDKVCDFIMGPFQNIRALDRYSRLKEQINRIFGKPKHISTERVPNIHEPKIMDKKYSLIYDGFIFKIYHAVSVNKELLNELVITKNSLPLKYGITFEMSRSQVMDLLGRPLDSSEDSLNYECGYDAMESATFIFEKSILEKIIINYYLD